MQGPEKSANLHSTHSPLSIFINDMLKIQYISNMQSNSKIQQFQVKSHYDILILIPASKDYSFKNTVLEHAR
jgi:hypothetical protein